MRHGARKCDFELWSDVPGYAGIYEVSNYGNFRSVVSGKPMKVTEHPTNGYGYINLSKERRATMHRVHRLVLMAFGYNPKTGLQCRHLDGIKMNNRLDNLKWGTALENKQDQARHGTLRGAHFGEDHHNAKLCRRSINYILQLRNDGLDQYKIAEKIGINQSQVSRILNGKAWQKTTARAERRL